MKPKINLTCERCGATLEETSFSENEMKEKLKNMDYQKPFWLSEKLFIQAIMKGYTSFQCSKCKWLKLVQNKQAEKLKENAKKWAKENKDKSLEELKNENKS
jgi:hypothetical protein